MGSASPEKKAKEAANRQAYEMSRKIASVQAGKIKTPAQMQLERGIGETMGRQVGIARSGFGGNLGNRIRNLDSAQADLGIRADVAQKILKEQELQRLRGSMQDFSDVSSGLEASGTGNTAANIAAGTSAAGSIFDTFGYNNKKK